MIPLGLSQKNMTKLNNLLVTHHIIDVTVQLLTLDHRYVMDVSNRLLGGQVTIDTTQDITRSLDMELLDPLHTLRLDGEAPDDGSLYFNRMFKITYSVIATDHSIRFDIPIFTGPISKVERDGAVISVTCVGKEKLAGASMWATRTFKKNLQKTYVIIKILRSIAGETKLQIPGAREKIPNNLSMNHEVTPWFVVRKLASSMGRQIFYDGRGVARLRPWTNKTIYHFTDNGALLTDPQPSYDAESVINAVEVIGGKPKGSKKKVSYRLVAPRNHPLSPWSMGRNGVPRYLAERIEDDSIKSVSAARSIARKRLRSALIEQVSVAFDSLPIPYLEEGDLCRVHSNNWTGTFRLSQMTIPLTADGVSSIGYLRRVTPNKRQLAIKHKHSAKAKAKKKRRR